MYCAYKKENSKNMFEIFLIKQTRQARSPDRSRSPLETAIAG